MLATTASVLLGAVFLLAGGSKLAAGAAWPAQAGALGVPRWLATAVPGWELLIGALLVVQVMPRLTAAAALVSLAVFTALLVVRLAQGRRPVCACFGAWSASPIGWAHVARNAAFAAIAVVALAAR